MGDPSTNPPTLAAVEQALRASWTADTSAEHDHWTAENPTLGQSAVSSIVVRALLGGEIVIATVLDRDGQPTADEHAWNRLPSGEEVDFTFTQFHDGEQLGPETVREPPITGDPARAERLAARVAKLLDVPVAL